MSSVITYHSSLDLPVPDDVRTVRLSLELSPPAASCLLYGALANGNMGCVRVSGAKTEIALPLCGSKIYVRGLGGAATIKVKTLEWQDSAGRLTRVS